MKNLEQKFNQSELVKSSKPIDADGAFNGLFSRFLRIVLSKIFKKNTEKMILVVKIKRQKSLSINFFKLFRNFENFLFSKEIFLGTSSFL